MGRALDSVYAQTRAVDQVIVVNDCSPETEAVEAVLREYPRVTYVRNGTNVGLAATRNVGVHAAEGDIVSFLDADDELHPQKIEYQLSLYRPDVAVSCRVKRIGNEVGIADVSRFSGMCPFSIYNSSRTIIRRNQLVGASIMMSRALFLEVGGYDDTLRSCEDFDLWLRLLDAGILAYDISLPLYLYRVNEVGLSSSSLSISRWELEVVTKYFMRHRAAGTPISGEGATLAFWLLKQLLRYERCREPLLLDAIVKNFDLLTPWPMWKAVVLAAEYLKVSRLAVAVKRLFAV